MQGSSERPVLEPVGVISSLDVAHVLAGAGSLGG